MPMTVGTVCTRISKKKDVPEKILLELGLISESKGKYYDKFRNRVMFPIINTSRESDRIWRTRDRTGRAEVFEFTGEQGIPKKE